MPAPITRRLLVTTACIAALSASAAQAATVNSASVVLIEQINGSPNDCVVTFTYSVTGTTNDAGSGGAIDFYSLGVFTASGDRYNAPNAFAVSVGSTTTPTRSFGFSNVSDKELRELRFFDTTVSGGTLGSPVFTVPLPRADMIAAGGGCAQMMPNGAPTSDAGPDQALAGGGGSVTLDGNASSDPDGDPLTYGWTQVSGPSVTLNGANTASPSFTAPQQINQPQQLVFALVATDGAGLAGAPDTVTITIPAGPNTAPTVDAGLDRSVIGNSQVSLTGTASDPDPDTLTYSWTQISGTPVTLAGAGTLNPTFTAPAGNSQPQVMVFELTVNDGQGGSVSDRVEITVAANTMPVADAGPDQGPIDTGNTITLDGSQSFDPENDALGYTWTQVSGSPVTLIGANTANPTFVAPNVQGLENLVFQLIVNDGQADSAPDTVTVAVRAVGTVTIVQRVVGDDRTFTYTSSIGALNGPLTTSGGTGQLSANLVPAGVHSITAPDLRAAGYALTDITCNDSDSTVNLAAGTVAVALSPNEDLVCTFTSADTRSAASAAINSFLTARNAALLTHQPDLQRRLDRLRGNVGAGGGVVAWQVPVPMSNRLPVSLNITDGGMQASTSLERTRHSIDPRDVRSRPFDLWFEGYVSRLSYGSHKGDLKVFYLGADYRLSDNLLVGAMIGLDDLNRKGALAPGAAEGDGWMAGPYVTARLAPNLYLDARAAWGKSDNTVSPLGTFTDRFDTRRSFYSSSLVGEVGLGNTTVLRPELVVRYLREKQLAYTDSMGVLIPSQVVDQGDISFRPRLSHSAPLGGGWIFRPYGEVEGIVTFGLPQQSVLGDGFRMRVEGGAEFLSKSGLRLGLGGFYDGIGGGTYDSKGVHVSVSLGF